MLLYSEILARERNRKLKLDGFGPDFNHPTAMMAMEVTAACAASAEILCCVGYKGKIQPDDLLRICAELEVSGENDRWQTNAPPRWPKIAYPISIGTWTGGCALELARTIRNRLHGIITMRVRVRFRLGTAVPPGTSLIHGNDSFPAKTAAAKAALKRACGDVSKMLLELMKPSHPNTILAEMTKLREGVQKEFRAAMQPITVGEQPNPFDEDEQAIIDALRELKTKSPGGRWNAAAVARHAFGNEADPANYKKKFAHLVRCQAIKLEGKARRSGYIPAD